MIRRSREEWEKICEDWKSSGLTRKAYGEKAGIKFKSLCRWIKELKPKVGGVKFLEAMEIKSKEELEIILPNGSRFKIAIGKKFLAELIKELL
jgi:hypothetical protein